MARGQVGYPRRDPVTGLITDHHLPTTDATREVCDSEFDWSDWKSWVNTQFACFTGYGTSYLQVFVLSTNIFYWFWILES